MFRITDTFVRHTDPFVLELTTEDLWYPSFASVPSPWFETSFFKSSLCWCLNIKKRICVTTESNPPKESRRYYPRRRYSTSLGPHPPPARRRSRVVSPANFLRQGNCRAQRIMKEGKQNANNILQRKGHLIDILTYFNIRQMASSNWFLLFGKARYLACRPVMVRDSRYSLEPWTQWVVAWISSKHPWKFRK